jgi:hypothetical protein
MAISKLVLDYGNVPPQEYPGYTWCIPCVNRQRNRLKPWMKEVRDNTSRKGGLPKLPGLYRSTIQPSRRGFYRIHVCEGGDNWRQYI